MDYQNPSVGSFPPNGHNRAAKIVVGIILAILLVLGGFYIWYLFKNKNPGLELNSSPKNSLPLTSNKAGDNQKIPELKTGLYSLDGSNSKVRYKGTVQIEKGSGDSSEYYLLKWTIGESEDQRGIGILDGNVLSVSYVDVTGGKYNDTGVVSYHLTEEGILKGKWVSAISNALLGGEEILTYKASVGQALSDLDLARAKARDAVRISDIRLIQLALETWYEAHNSYPDRLQVLDLRNLSSDPAKKPYADVLTKQPYFYASCSAPSYHLGSNLETNSPSLQSDADKAPMCASDKINGTDNNGCDGKSGFFCYDIAI